MKPIIGLFVTVDNEKNTTATNSYVNAVTYFGGIAVVLPYTNSKSAINSYAKLCNGFIFCGGNDVEPSRYGENIINDTVKTEIYRDEFEFTALSVILPTNKPIMGICRGCQIINVALKGSLYQDVKTQIKTEIFHSQKESKSEYSHKINVIKSTPLYYLSGGLKRINGNSFHHQSIKKLGNNLKVMAFADDGVIEGAYFDGDRYLMLYQWHPERLFCKDKISAQIFQNFISACKKYR